VAELSAAEAQRLARLFLTGRADAADMDRVATALPEDQTLALELLSQMQSALDDVAPTTLSAEQNRSVDSRIEALIGPRIKKRGLFGWLKKLFRRSPKPAEEAAPSRRRRRGGSPEPAAPAPETALPPPSSAPAGDDMMEEMVPISSGDASPTPAAEPTAEAGADAEAEASPKPKAKAGGKKFDAAALRPVLLGLLALALAGGLILGVMKLWHGWQARRAASAAALAARPKPTPMPVAAAPTALPTPGPSTAGAGSVHRGRAIAVREDEPLPSQLPPTTPQAAGQLDPP
jgi:hypothetical protein